MKTHTHLVVIAGPAGVGKSELARGLARRLRYSYLDKDTLAGPLTGALLVALDSPLGSADRDSDIYANAVRPAEYAGLMDTAMENVGLGVSTIIDAPFLREINDPSWRTAVEEGCRDAAAGPVSCHCVWVRCDGETMRRRLIGRNAERDLGKLENWEDYLERLADLKAPLAPFLEIDSSGDADTENSVERIIKEFRLG